MIRPGLMLLIGILAAPSLLRAQTVVRPDPPLDAERAKLRDALLVVRDSLQTIDAAAARLQRDYREAAAISLVARARTMRAACAGSDQALGPARGTVRAAKVVGALRSRRRLELLEGLDRLQEALTRCQAQFGVMSEPDQGERVRGYGNDRAVRVQAALRRYEGTLGQFLGAMGIKVRPPGAGPPPLSG